MSEPSVKHSGGSGTVLASVVGDLTEKYSQSLDLLSNMVWKASDRQ